MSRSAELQANADPHPAEPPKKRRRKASTNGAGEDCATCRKKGSYCDRKRPYCGACVDDGKECPGYKTVLTWGVGVASRGKLRGMSLPVPVPVARVTHSSNPIPIPTESKSRTSAQARTRRNRTMSIKSESGYQDQSKPYTTQGQTQFKHETSWQLPPPQPKAASRAPPSRTNSDSRPLPPFLSHVLNPPYPEEIGHTAYSNSMASPESSRTASEYGSYSGRFDRTMSGDSSLGEDYFPQHSFPNSYHMSTFETSSIREDPITQAAPQMPAEMMLDPRLSNAEYVMPLTVQSAIDPSLQPVNYQGNDDVSPTDSNNESSTTSDDTAETDVIEISRDDQVAPSSGYLDSVKNPLLVMPLYDISSRMRSLMDYYDKFICPVVVAFDAAPTSNPYRTYILSLCMQDAGLRHAVAALALNNMRMKDANVMPRFLAATSDDMHEEIDDAVVVPPATAEELRYKAFAVQHLNVKLKSAISARDDSVLATLLVLCLFHVSDSGFSKFKTQLFGVRKILMLRGQMFHTEFVSWVQIFFAWFDAMTSAVNDREVEISGEYIDLNTTGNDLGTPEQYSGCEGQLFKLISRLGRLNLLAQEKPVSNMIAARSTPQPSFFTNMSSYTMDFDGMSDDGMSNEQQPDPDHRTLFWQEWRDIRQSLAQWELQHMVAPFMISMEELPVPQRDMLNISECFRHAALLYTERLANPDLPSSVDNFQGIVAQALFHISQISDDSCVTKFTLWPLFIIGTECITNEHRQMIRKRIIDIYNESGFYNNLSSLRVLMKIWKENADGLEAPSRDSVQAFRWRKAMDRQNGEYIII